MKNKIVLIIYIFCIVSNLNTKNISFGLEKNIAVTAHRGIHYNNDENSINSIQNAIKEGVDYVEIDLRMTKDNKIILCHDSTLERRFGECKKVNELTLEQINIITENQIPTLEDVFLLFNKQVRFNLELKTKEKNNIFIEEVQYLINKYDLKNYVIISSFNKNLIEEYKNMNKDIRVGYISSNKDEDFINLNVDFLSLKYELINKKLVEDIHYKNKEVYVWTVNSEEKIKEMSNSGVDNIITDEVSLTKKILHNI